MGLAVVGSPRVYRQGGGTRYGLLSSIRSVTCDQYCPALTVVLRRRRRVSEVPASKPAAPLVGAAGWSLCVGDYYIVPPPGAARCGRVSSICEKPEPGWCAMIQRNAPVCAGLTRGVGALSSTSTAHLVAYLERNYPSVSPALGDPGAHRFVGRYDSVVAVRCGLRRIYRRLERAARVLARLRPFPARVLTGARPRISVHQGGGRSAGRLSRCGCGCTRPRTVGVRRCSELGGKDRAFLLAAVTG